MSTSDYDVIIIGTGAGGEDLLSGLPGGGVEQPLGVVDHRLQGVHRLVHVSGVEERPRIV